MWCKIEHPKTAVGETGTQQPQACRSRIRQRQNSVGHLCRWRTHSAKIDLIRIGREHGLCSTAFHRDGSFWLVGIVARDPYFIPQKHVAYRGREDNFNEAAAPLCDNEGVWQRRICTRKSNGESRGSPHTHTRHDQICGAAVLDFDGLHLTAADRNRAKIDTDRCQIDLRCIGETDFPDSGSGARADDSIAIGEGQSHIPPRQLSQPHIDRQPGLTSVEGSQKPACGGRHIHDFGVRFIDGQCPHLQWCQWPVRTPIELGPGHTAIRRLQHTTPIGGNRHGTSVDGRGQVDGAYTRGVQLIPGSRPGRACVSTHQKASGCGRIHGLVIEGGCDVIDNGIHRIPLRPLNATIDTGIDATTEGPGVHPPR